MAHCSRRTRGGSASSITSPDAFHQALHRDLDKPYPDPQKNKLRQRAYPNTYSQSRARRESHTLEWVNARINLSLQHVKINIGVNFQNADVETDKEFERLKAVARRGINKFWSRNITVGGHQFCVKVNAFDRPGPKSLPLDIYVDSSTSDIMRGRNSGLFFMTARIVHAPNYYGRDADRKLELDAAHEVGHSILLNAEGVRFSWTHKGTSTMFQEPSSSAPAYPESKSQPVDLMKYYDKSKNRLSVTQLYNRKKASEKDVKRLVWGSKLEWQ